MQLQTAQGFKSVKHQGYMAAKFDKLECPYPANSQAAKDWQSGVNQQKRGDPYEE